MLILRLVAHKKKRYGFASLSHKQSQEPQVEQSKRHLTRKELEVKIFGYNLIQINLNFLQLF